MIQIDMEMPKSCYECPLFEDDVCYLDGKYAISVMQAETKPSWCPLEEPKTGHWKTTPFGNIYCSECDKIVDKRTHYCGNCGSDNYSNR